MESAHPATPPEPRSAPLSTDLARPEALAYFLWDDPISVASLRHRLETSSPEERTRLLGKILREARDTDVWRFTTPQEIATSWGRIAPHLGRRREFWEFLFRTWREQGLLDAAR